MLKKTILGGVIALVLSGCGGTFSNETVDPEVSRCITTLAWAARQHGHGISNSMDTIGRTTTTAPTLPQRSSLGFIKYETNHFSVADVINEHCAQFLDEELITAFESGLIDASLSPTATAIAPATPGGPDDPDFTGGLGSSNETP
jgi:hypothetical protein